jgi:hypothetical protein
MCDRVFTDGATKGRELTLKELGVSDPKEVMSRFLHEQRTKELVKALVKISDQKMWNDSDYDLWKECQKIARQALKNFFGGE